MTCFHTSPPSPAAANFSATILRMVYVAGLRRLEWTSLCKTRIAFTFLIARSLLCRSAAISPSASRASGESMSAPSGSSCPGVSMAVKGLPRSPNQLRLAYDVFLVHDSLPASVEKRGPSSSSPLAAASPASEGEGRGTQLKSNSAASRSPTKVHPASRLSRVDLPAPVQPMTSSRFSDGSARWKSSSVEKMVSCEVLTTARSPISLSAPKALRATDFGDSCAASLLPSDMFLWVGGCAEAGEERAVGRWGRARPEL
mmetsp:Transcript_38212/g.124990  ORF Transcript_38212/g.124990 Transcript_38212/m.124990 type:complete len:257 (-) Transcript_38212:19-789(-)